MSSTPGRLVLQPKQAEWAEAAFSGQYRYLLAGGAIRGAKTVGALAIIFTLCRVFPRSRWAIVRKDLPTLKRNTIPTFEKFKPAGFFGQINKSDWVVRARNGSEILFFPESFDIDPDLNRWRGLEVNGFFGDEANELQEASFLKMIERSASWIIQPTEDDPTPRQPPPLILLTCNPADNWVRQRFYDPHHAGTLAPPYYFLPLGPRDNEYNTPEQWENWRGLPEREYKKFIEGDWSVLEDPAQLIRSEWIRNAANVEPVRGVRRLGVDVARYGDDSSCWATIDGNELVAMHDAPMTAIDEVADMTRARIQDPNAPINADRVRVDVVGLGAGVVDILRAQQYDVEEFSSGGKATEDKESAYQFKDRRSQAWWTLREMLRKGELSIAPALLERYPKLIQDLTAPRYLMSSDRVIKVESKDEIRKRIGRSTDYGDALMMAVAPAHPRPQVTPLRVRWG